MSLPPVTRLNDMIGPAVEAMGYEFVACEFAPMGQRMVLRIYLDSAQGVTIQDCQTVSRQLGALLEVESPTLGKYYLEVSSPGSDRLLVTESHFERFVGHSIKVKLRHARDGRRNYTGLLQAVLEGKLTLVVDGDTYILAISDIEKANLVPDK